MSETSQISLSLLNGHLICGLCGGYLIDATVLTNCIHAFCRSCILKYIAEKNNVCPLCQTRIREGRSCSDFDALLPDVALQRLVYKLVPGLLKVEMDRVAEFHRRFLKNPSKVAREIRLSCKESQAPDESGSSDGLSAPTPTPLATRALSRSTINSIPISKKHSIPSFPPETSISCLIDPWESVSVSLVPLYLNSDNPFVSANRKEIPGDTVYLLCPASCTVAHLQRFIMAKYYNLPSPAFWTVDMYLNQEYLQPAHSLRELAFLYAWPTQHRVMTLYYHFSDTRIAWWNSNRMQQQGPSTSSSRTGN